MTRLSSKLRQTVTNLGAGVLFWCPGCQELHAVTVERGRPGAWGYNDNPEAPSFTPSVLVEGVERLREDEYQRVLRGETITPRPLRCHSYVTDGHIRFLSDCSHALRGQTVPLPPIPPEWCDDDHPMTPDPRTP